MIARSMRSDDLGDLLTLLSRRQAAGGTGIERSGLEQALCVLFRQPELGAVFVLDEGGVPVGGAVVTIAPAPASRGGSWADDDTIVFASPAGLSRVSASGGTPQMILTVDPGNSLPTTPHVLPSGRGILYAPDYVVNAGGVIHLVSYEMIHETDDDVAERLRRIGDTLGEVFGRAEADGISTGAAADAIVAQRLAAARKA